jgi:hypothetical protein
MLFEQEPANEASQKISVIHNIFCCADEFNMPHLYDIAIEAFAHPYSSEEFKQNYFFYMTSQAFPYFRDLLHSYLEKKYAQQKEMAKSVTSVISKSSELDSLESKINILESELNEFEPTPKTDFNEGLPII